MDETPDNNKAAEEVLKQAEDVVQEASRRLRVVEGGKGKAKATKPPVLDVLHDCPQDQDENGKAYLAFYKGVRPQKVRKEALDVVVYENQRRIAEGGFHHGLIFRQGDTDNFITLIRDPDTGIVSVMPLTGEHLSNALSERFCFIKPTKDNPLNHESLPKWFYVTVNGQDRYRFPILRALLQHPAIHLDGTVVTREGYDSVSKCWVTAGWDNLKVPAKPTPKQVQAAIQTLREPFEEVIFKGDEINGHDPVKKPGVDMSASEANVLGMILTAFLRRQMDLAPLFIITSTQWGTAKGLVVQVMAKIVTGSAPHLTDIKESKDQSEKNIDRTLIDFPDAYILQFDEAVETGGRGGGRFHFRKLALLATAAAYNTRAVFGRKAVTIDAQRMMTFTANSLRPDKDTVRRVSVIELAIPEDGTLPHERTFKHKDRGDKVKLLAWVGGRREEYITAVITLVNAWATNGHSPADFEFDFPEWVHTVGGVLQHAGVSAWMSNRGDVYTNADEALRCAFIHLIAEAVGNGPYSSRQLATLITGVNGWEDMKDALIWEDGYATGLHTAWGAAEAMVKPLGQLLNTFEGRMLSDGAGGWAKVTSKPHWKSKSPIWTLESHPAKKP